MSFCHCIFYLIIIVQQIIQNSSFYLYIDYFNFKELNLFKYSKRLIVIKEARLDNRSKVQYNIKATFTRAVTNSSMGKWNLQAELILSQPVIEITKLQALRDDATLKTHLVKSRGNIS